MRRRLLIAILGATPVAGVASAQDFTMEAAPISMQELQAQAVEACQGAFEFGPATITLAEIDGDGRTDLLFDWSKVSCASPNVGRGAGMCGMHMCSIDLYASSTWQPGGYPQGILALDFEVQPLGSDIILRTTSMGGSCPFAQTCDHAWRWTGAKLEAAP